MWIRYATTNSDNRALWVGSRADAIGNSSRYGHELVQGNFDGWFAALSLNLHWRLP
jgi:hypothetical protein